MKKWVKILWFVIAGLLIFIGGFYFGNIVATNAAEARCAIEVMAKEEALKLLTN
jgi:alpha/beta superfamily hydrolase